MSKASPISEIPFTQILRLIRRIRESFEGSVEVYTQGSCIKFCMILLEIYPEGKILYDQSHAIFQIGDKCYDINGRAEKTKNHCPIEEYGLLKMYDSMNLMYTNNQNELTPNKENKMSNIPTQEENPKGLHQRYVVSKANGNPVDDDAEYFVLRLDKGGSDINHVKACRKALMTYAREIEPFLPELGFDLVKRYHPSYLTKEKSTIVLEEFLKGVSEMAGSGEFDSVRYWVYTYLEAFDQFKPPKGNTNE